jgi:hypothetical protein
MRTQSSWEEVEQACRVAGLPTEMLDQLRDRLVPANSDSVSQPVTAREQEIMKLIGTNSVDRLVHDVRNLLNEITLLRAVADLGEKS